MSAPLSPYQFARPVPPALSTASGKQAHIFQPPRTPVLHTATPLYPQPSSGNDYFSHPNTSRKRSRPDSRSGGNDCKTPWSEKAAWSNIPTPLDGSADLNHVNDRYMLAGGYDTPSLAAAAAFEHSTYASDSEGRRRCRDISDPSYEPSLSQGSSGPLARERNGHARVRSSPNGQQPSTLTGFVLGLAGAVVGRAFNFGTSAFRGFFSGGGKSYTFDRPAPRHEPDFWHGESTSGTPLPGSWVGEAGDEFLGDFEQDNITPERPGNKRRQTDREKWVMVPTPESQDLSPKRKSAPRPSLAPKSTASRASSRCSLMPVSRRQHSNVSHTGSPAVQPLSPSRRASLAPTRSRPSSAGDVVYPSPEAEHYAMLKERQERQADKAIGKMSRQLQELLAQGRAALGTKIEVEDDIVVDGGMDDGWDMRY